MRRFHAAMRGMEGYRTRFLIYLSAAFVPFLVIALIANVHFLNTHLADTAEIVCGVARQAENQLSSIYDTTAGLAQNVRLHTTLQDEVLPTNGRVNDYQTLSRNFQKLRGLVDAFSFSDEILELKFYLPSEMVIPNGKFLLEADIAPQESWYSEYMEQRNIRRWYVADAAFGSGARDVLCLICPLQDALDFSKTIGYLRVDVSRARIEEVLSSGLVIDGASCFLLDADGRVICSSGASGEGLLEGLDLAARPGYEYVSLDGRSYLAAVGEIGASAMRFVYLAPRANLTRNILANYLLQAVLLVAEILLLAVVTGLFAYSLISARNNQLKLLNCQINPHFLYNTLDLINWQAINQNLPEIYRPIQALSRFYKITLNHGSDFIRVSDELEQLRLYLDLQNIRFKGSIVYRIEAEAEVRDCVILHMVLQPIVENSVLHGIREKGDQAGNLCIRAVRERNHLLFTIEDDGVGMDEEAVRRLLRGDSRDGYGLANIQQRIRLFYGSKYGIKIESRPNEGTRVEIRMPGAAGGAR